MQGYATSLISINAQTMFNEALMRREFSLLAKVNSTSSTFF